MNKAKISKLAEEVLLDIQEDMQDEMKKHMELKLTEAMSNIFRQAHYYLEINQSNYVDAYNSVKPILDDALANMEKKTK